MIALNRTVAAKKASVVEQARRAVFAILVAIVLSPGLSFVTNGSTANAQTFLDRSAGHPHPAPFLQTGFLTSGAAFRLFAGKTRSIDNINGVAMGELTVSPSGLVTWQTSNEPAIIGSLTFNGNSGCFAYTIGTYCYDYLNDGRQIIGYLNGRPDHFVRVNRQSYRAPVDPTAGQCPMGQAVYCGASMCTGFQGQEICTRDYFCRCELGGQPSWVR